MTKEGLLGKEKVISSHKLLQCKDGISNDKSLGFSSGFPPFISSLTQK